MKKKFFQLRNSKIFSGRFIDNRLYKTHFSIVTRGDGSKSPIELAERTKHGTL